jgi:hypothetical protein
MRQVYRARDTTLGRARSRSSRRMPSLLTPNRLVRFEREAKPLASLNHPHIEAIYGSGDVRSSCKLEA